MEQFVLQYQELSRFTWRLEFWWRFSRPIPLQTLYIQRIVAGYYLMTQRLLALYEVSHAGLGCDLERALFRPETV